MFLYIFFFLFWIKNKFCQWYWHKYYFKYMISFDSWMIKFTVTFLYFTNDQKLKYAFSTQPISQGTLFYIYLFIYVCFFFIGNEKSQIICGKPMDKCDVKYNMIWQMEKIPSKSICKIYHVGVIEMKYYIPIFFQGHSFYVSQGRFFFFFSVILPIYSQHQFIFISIIISLSIFLYLKTIFKSSS